MFDITPTAVAPAAKPAPVVTTIADSVARLRAAAGLYKARGDGWRVAVCMDIAAKVERFKSFASPKQQAFALSLIEQAYGPATTAVAGTPAAAKPDNSIAVPDLHAVMQKHARFYVGAYTISRRNADQLCWIKREGYEQVVGKIDAGKATVLGRRLSGEHEQELRALLGELEANPLAAAKKYGKLAGRCCSCGRELTDESSIAAGIGPICAEKFA